MKQVVMVILIVLLLTNNVFAQTACPPLPEMKRWLEENKMIDPAKQYTDTDIFLRYTKPLNQFERNVRKNIEQAASEIPAAAQAQWIANQVAKARKYFYANLIARRFGLRPLGAALTDSIRMLETVLKEPGWEGLDRTIVEGELRSIKKQAEQVIRLRLKKLTQNQVDWLLTTALADIELSTQLDITSTTYFNTVVTALQSAHGKNPVLALAQALQGAIAKGDLVIRLKPTVLYKGISLSPEEINIFLKQGFLAAPVYHGKGSYEMIIDQSQIPTIDAMVLEYAHQQEKKIFVEATPNSDRAKAAAKAESGKVGLLLKISGLTEDQYIAEINKDTLQLYLQQEVVGIIGALSLRNVKEIKVVEPNGILSQAELDKQLLPQEQTQRIGDLEAKLRISTFTFPKEEVEQLFNQLEERGMRGLQEIGRGSFGIAFEYTAPSRKSYVIKLSKMPATDDFTFSESDKSYSKLEQLLGSPEGKTYRDYVPRYYGMKTVSGFYVQVFDMIKGAVPLEHFVVSGNIPQGITRQAFEPLEKLLAFANSKGIYHNDIGLPGLRSGPHNVLWDGEKLYVIDWGGGGKPSMGSGDVERFKQLVLEVMEIKSRAG